MSTGSSSCSACHTRGPSVLAIGRDAPRPRERLMPDPARIFAVTGDGVARFSVDGHVVRGIETVLGDVDARCIAVDPHDPASLYVGTFDDGLYTSHDGGRSWELDGRGLDDRRVLSVAVSPSHREAGTSVAYAGT